MKHPEIETRKEPIAQPNMEYEAPRIELVVTGQDLEREVHYAGFNSPARP